MTIRTARADDKAWIGSLIPRLHEFGPPGYRSIEAMNESEALATLAAVDGGAERVVLVAERDGERAGFVHLETAVDFFTRERHGHISTLIVAPGHEQQGVGRALLDAAEAWCRTQGYLLLTLNVFEGNSTARRLYERAGFAIDTIKYLKPLS
jgi:ribosomal protein S18 acetylase RimI-like enzyme